MTRYIKDTQGRFAGSVGDGRDRVPTPAQHLRILADQVDSGEQLPAELASVLAGLRTDRIGVHTVRLRRPVNADTVREAADVTLEYRAQENFTASYDNEVQEVNALRALAAGEKVEEGLAVYGLATMVRTLDNIDPTSRDSWVISDAVDDLTDALPASVVCAAANDVYGVSWTTTSERLDAGVSPWRRDIDTVRVHPAEVSYLAYASEETLRAAEANDYDQETRGALFRVRQLAAGEQVDAADVVIGMAAIARLYDIRADADEYAAPELREALDEVAQQLPRDVVCAIAMRVFGREYRYSNAVLDAGENPLIRN